MKNRYKKTFEKLEKGCHGEPVEPCLAFCPFAVLGDPDEKQTLERIEKYLAAGADMLELGIPFSDPIADGPVIQAASERAINAGMTPKKAIQLIAKIRALVIASTAKQSQLDCFGLRPRNDIDIPIGILTYANIAHHYGIEKFYRDLARAGADSVLLADVPLEEIRPFLKAARKNHLAQIFIVSENTSLPRFKEIVKIATGYLYVVSTLGVTGAKKTLPPSLNPMLSLLAKHTYLPLMVGFGISTPAHIRTLKKSAAHGVIVGSALVQTPLKKLAPMLNAFSKATG